jgi:hypothetical protein
MQNVPREAAIIDVAEQNKIDVEAARGIIDKKPFAGAAVNPSIPGFNTYATSTLYRGVVGEGENAEVVLQWVKEARDKSKEAAEEMIKALAEGLPKVKPTEAKKKNYRDDVIAVYPMGDPHFGMFAWGEETGQDFDLKIAERDLCTAVARLVDTVPSCEEALIINLGDFFHADNQSGTTTKGTVLDTDTRWSKVLRVGVKAMRQCVASALEKHKHVTVINAIGNHDAHTSQVLSIALGFVYENEPRVTINDAPTIKHYKRFGQNLFGVHHGHSIKMKDLPFQMATDKPNDWGETRYRYWFTGHIHHHSSDEFGGVVVESFRTLAPQDAWHTQQGYKSGRDMKSILFHKDFGEIERHTVSVEMLNN